MNLKTKIKLKIGHISGVRSRDLIINNDDRGILYEMLRMDWDEVYGSLTLDPKLHAPYWEQKIKQLYIVQNHDMAIRAYHKHEHLVDIFCLVRGHAKFILVDDRPKCNTFGTMEIINVCDKKPEILIVPAGIFHGWKGSPDCILVSVANDLYKGPEATGEIDEERIPWDTFGATIWETQFK